MPVYFIEAFGGDDLPILGNLDGQGVIRASRYERTNAYKRRCYSGPNPLRPRWSRTKFWRIVTQSGTPLVTIPNAYYQAKD